MNTYWCKVYYVGLNGFREFVVFYPDMVRATHFCHGYCSASKDTQYMCIERTNIESDFWDKPKFAGD